MFIRTFVYSSIIILISICSFFGNLPLISNYLHDVENKTYDLFFITRDKLNLNPKPPDNIVIVGIDATSIDKVGIPWPWPRQFHASLVDALVSAGAKLIVFDIIFDTISPLSLQTEDISGKDIIAKTSFDSGKEDDEIFASSLKKAMNLVLACEAEPLSKNDYYPVTPIKVFINALNNDISSLGNTSVKYDSDNFVRTAEIVYPEFYKDPAISSSITLRALQKYLNIRAQIQSDNSVLLGKKKIPASFLINYHGPAETINTIPFWKALGLMYRGKDSIFKDKIVFIGRTKLKASIDPFSVRSPDSFATPFASITPNFSGVEIQATIFSNLLNSSFIVKMSNQLFLPITLFISLIATLIVWKFRQRLIACFYLCTFLSLIYLFLSFELFIFSRISIPPTYPIYGIILPIFFINFLDQYLFFDRARRRQAKIFRQLVPAQVADEIEGMDFEQLALGGKRREITILFTDIKNFTGLCERCSPEQVVTILNQFFTEMVKVIHKHNGLVDKFIGDAIMAIWGTPKSLEKGIQAELAAKCALAMNDELKKLNQQWNNQGFKEKISTRIGINTDEAITGNIGSLERIQYSAIGDAVNIASRLESANKIYGTNILLSENTASLIKDKFQMREIDTVILPGKDKPIKIFELINQEQFITDLVNHYSIGLKNYRNKDFEGSIRQWQKCLEINPHDAPSSVMLNRTMKFKGLKENTNWSPIWEIENK